LHQQKENKFYYCRFLLGYKNEIIAPDNFILLNQLDGN